MRSDLLELVEAAGRRTLFEAELDDIDRVQPESVVGQAFAKKQLANLSDYLRNSIRAFDESRTALVREGFQSSEIEKVDRKVKLQELRSDASLPGSRSHRDARR